MKNVKAAMAYLKTLGITENDANIVSFGDQGCYLFYIDSDNNIKKEKLSLIGITYLDEADLLEKISLIDIRRSAPQTRRQDEMENWRPIS